MQTEHFKPFNVVLVAAWFGASFTSLIFSILFSLYLTTPKTVRPVSQSFKLYAALPPNGSKIEDKIEYADARSKIIENFFKGYNSPLANFAHIFVDVADKYHINYRLLPAISMQESNGGRRIIADSFNPFGYGIYGNSVLRFNSWEEAIEKVGKSLKENYINLGLNTPEKIMPKYTPPSLAKGGSWAKGVSSFMEKLR